MLNKDNWYMQYLTEYGCLDNHSTNCEVAYDFQEVTLTENFKEFIINKIPDFDFSYPVSLYFNFYHGFLEVYQYEKDYEEQHSSYNFKLNFSVGEMIEKEEIYFK